MAERSVLNSQVVNKLRAPFVKRTGADGTFKPLNRSESWQEKEIA